MDLFGRERKVMSSILTGSSIMGPIKLTHQEYQKVRKQYKEYTYVSAIASMNH